MGYRPGDAYCKTFATSSSSGALTNADATPSATPNHNGTDDGAFSLTVASLSTGRYKITGTVPAGYSGGDVVNVWVAATIGGVPIGNTVDTFVLDRVGPFKVDTANGFEFAMVSSVDHVTAFTAGGVTATREIAGAGTTTAAGTVTQIGSTNRYYFSGTAADFNGANVTFTFTATGADSVVVTINTTP